MCPKCGGEVVIECGDNGADTPASIWAECVDCGWADDKDGE